MLPLGNAISNLLPQNANRRIHDESWILPLQHLIPSKQSLMLVESCATLPAIIAMCMMVLTRCIVSFFNQESNLGVFPNGGKPRPGNVSDAYLTHLKKEEIHETKNHEEITYQEKFSKVNRR